MRSIMQTATDSPDAASPPSPRLDGIQALRGVAALCVVLFHAREEVGLLGQSTWLPDMTAGAFGVDLFFVVSGFVMLHASSRDFGSTRSVAPFLWRRLRRVGPLYWMVTLAFLLVATSQVRNGMTMHDMRVHVWSSLAFVPWLFPNDGADPAYPLGWTLSFETAFYVCFACALPLPRRLAVATLSTCLVVAGVAGTLGRVVGAAGYLATSQLLEFVAGLGVAWAVGAGMRVGPKARLALAVASVAAVLASVPWIDGWIAWRGLAWGLPAAGVVVAATTGGAGSESGSGVVARGLAKLGDASYALYLVHYLLFVAMEEVASRLVVASTLPGGITFAAFVTCAVTAGLGLHRWVEAPVARMLRGRWWALDRVPVGAGQAASWMTFGRRPRRTGPNASPGTGNASGA